MRAVNSNAHPLPPADAYVFDIDGTLLVAHDLVHWNAFCRAMREGYGVDATLDGVPCHGMTDLLILRAALARAGVESSTFEANLPRALEIMRREVEANRQQFSMQTCPGIEELLRRLHGHMLGVASGNLESIGWRKLEAAGLREFFSFGCFSDSCHTRAEIFQNAIAHVRRQLGAQARTCFIGDTPHDVHAAREVGASIVAVASGIFSFDELNACSPDVCIAHCGELMYSPAP
jgi:HAD superfamily hydrolase (TIGR01549 family)